MVRMVTKTVVMMVMKMVVIVDCHGISHFPEDTSVAGFTTGFIMVR